MGRHAKTQRIIDEAYAILAAFNPMTVRQVYYQLVSRQVVENSRGAYQSVSDALVAARREGMIPWSWVEDRLRQVRHAGDGWEDVEQYWRAHMRYIADGYSRAVWPTQPTYIEAWLEKDALSGILEDALLDYHVPLNVGRGYDGWSSIYQAAQRYAQHEQAVTILYFGDFDPSGEDMVRSLRDRLAALDSLPTILKVALTPEDIERYSLPPNFTKATDSRRQKHIERFGDLSVELDALPPDVLRDRIVSEVESHLDLDALQHIREQERRERQHLADRVRRIS